MENDDEDTETDNTQPNSIDTMDGLNTMLDGLDTNAEGGTPTDVNTEDPEKNSDTKVDDPDATPPDKDPKPNPTDTKAAAAFADMRIKNKQYSDVIKSIAGSLNIDTADEAAMMAALNDDVMTKLAEAQKVPKELLVKMQGLETFQKQQLEIQARTKALNSFEGLKTAFNVDNARLQEFAGKLDEMQINPFIDSTVNLEKEYRNIYFEEIMQKQVQDAVEAALKKDGVATEQSSTPGTKVGKQSTGGEKKVNNVRELNTYLDNLK